MFNKVILVGHIVRDIDLRYTQGGTAIGNSSIAVNKKWTDNNGTKQDKTMFVEITFFGKSAEIASQYLRKGSKTLIEGELDFQQWTDNNGQNRSKHVVLVNSMEMLGSNENTQPNNGYQNNNVRSQTPQQNGYSQNNSGYSYQSNYQNNQQYQAKPQVQQQRQESYSEIPNIDSNVDDDFSKSEITF